MYIVGGVLLADGAEAKVVTGVHDHSWVAPLTPTAARHPASQGAAFTAARLLHLALECLSGVL